jgi:hypothetical protein
MEAKMKIQKRWLWISVLVLLAFFGQNLVAAQPVAAQEMTHTTYAAYQDFEHGFMVWREDTGGVLVFLTTSNVVYRFPESVYAYLPDNPVMEEPPSGLVKPIRGFGRVWGHFEYVRNQIGWGLETEFGYTATISQGVGTPTGERISLPDDSVVEFHADGHWYDWSSMPPTPIPPPPPGPYLNTTTGAVQEFERGMMLYAANSGTVWVLTHSGTAYTFRTQDYGGLPENPFWGAPPPGYMRPILGFGKVWGNFLIVRQALGWAVAYEDSYQMQVGTNANYSRVVLQLPDAQWVEIATNGNWYYR